MDIYAHADGSRECRPLNEIAPDRSNERPGEVSPKGKTAVRSVELPDHAVAWCAWMREQIERVELRGQAVHEVAGDMVLPVQFAARRI